MTRFLKKSFKTATLALWFPRKWTIEAKSDKINRFGIKVRTLKQKREENGLRVIIKIFGGIDKVTGN